MMLDEGVETLQGDELAIACYERGLPVFLKVEGEQIMISILRSWAILSRSPNARDETLANFSFSALLHYRNELPLPKAK